MAAYPKDKEGKGQTAGNAPGVGTKLLAAAGIVLTTMIWGGSFVAMKNSVALVPPTWLLALRFSVAALAMCLVFYRHMKKITKESFGRGVILGVFLELSYLFQTYGLKYTTASKNAFITTLYVILVPFLYWIISRQRPKRNQLAAAVIAVIGLALLSLEGDMRMNLGDFLTLICGICFAFHMVLIDRFTETSDPVILTAVQIAAAAVLSWCLAPFLDGGFAPSILADASLWGSILYLALFASMVAFLLQNMGQKYLSANTSSILLSLESVFGAVFSAALLGERLTGRMSLGCVLMFCAVILSEVKLER